MSVSIIIFIFNITIIIEIITKILITTTFWETVVDDANWQLNDEGGILIITAAATQFQRWWWWWWWWWRCSWWMMWVRSWTGSGLLSQGDDFLGLVDRRSKYLILSYCRCLWSCNKILVAWKTNQWEVSLLFLLLLHGKGALGGGPTQILGGPDWRADRRH